MNNELLKNEFIKFFGEEKWNEEELLKSIYKEELFLSSIMGVDPIPVVFDNLENVNGLFDIDEEYIILSNKLINKDKTYILETFIHEFRHYYQMIMIKNNPLKYSHFRYALKNNNHNNVIDYYMDPLELDAYSFSRAMMKYVYELPYKTYGEGIDNIIDDYIKSHNLFDFIERS